MPDTPSRHALERGIVLEDLRVVFVPIPKAACTSLLWLLADLMELQAPRFAASTNPEVTPALTVHDLSRWPNNAQLRRREKGWFDEVTADPEWLVFTVVREPTARVWSAWQSKILMREPQFVRRYSQEEWFARRPHSPVSVLRDFRRFVDAVVADTAHDPHWDPQYDLVGPHTYDHVGHIEELDTTLAILASHVGQELPRVRERNSTPLPAPWNVLAPDVREALVEHFDRDYTTFAYEPPSRPGPRDAADAREEWHRVTHTLIPVLDDIIERNRRIGRLVGLLNQQSPETP